MVSYIRQSMKQKLYLLLSSVFLFFIGFIVIANYVITKNAIHKTFTETTYITKNKVGLVLGTSKYLKGGGVNLYFKHRITAAVDLYKSGKIEFILVSGDNSTKFYNEPTTFKNELIKNGVPASKIFLDYAGFRTLDSVVRAKEIFGQEEITIISQKFHNERAIYIAEKHGIVAIGYNAKAIKGKYGIKTTIREYFARAKVFVDILLGITPKFLGNKVEIA